MSTKEIVFTKFEQEKDKRAAVVDVVDHVMKVIFFYFEEDQEGLEDDSEMEAFSDYVWDIAVSAVSTLGINIIGRDDNGKLIASLDPCDSVKEFLINEDIGEDDHVYYEDYCDEPGPDSAFGLHDERLTAITD